MITPQDDVGNNGTGISESSAADACAARDIRSLPPEAFFRDRRAAIDAAMPIEVLGARSGEGVFSEAQLTLPLSLRQQLQAQAREQDVTVASLCHLAWAQVVARCSGFYRRVAFGAVLPSGAPINSACGSKAAALAAFPLRVDLDNLSMAACLRQVDARLADLSWHASRYAPNPAQRDALTTPFVALLQYRQRGFVADGNTALIYPEQAHAPLAMSVEDSEQAVTLVARTRVAARPPAHLRLHGAHADAFSRSA